MSEEPKPGHRIRVTPAVRLEGYVAGDTGHVLWIYQPPGKGREHAVCGCAMERVGGRAACFYLDEIELYQ